MTTQVHDEPGRSRYEAVVDGATAGSASYRLAPGRITFTHTEVDDVYEGQGIGSALVQGALDDARSRGLQVVAMCPFVARFIERHAEYQDLVAP